MARMLYCGPSVVLLLAVCVLQYEKNEEVQEYFGHMLEVMKHQKVFFDLGSILIKPVQRILKYPLLLNQLYKVRSFRRSNRQYKYLACFFLEACSLY